jgi:hypothetical protein
MTALPLQILNPAWWMGANSFRLIYAFMSVVTAAAVARLVGNATPRAVNNADTLSTAARQSPRSIGMIPLLALVILILMGYVAVAQRENFTDTDESYFTLFTLRGHNIAPPIWPDSGRFFPLAHQEFNLIRHFTNSGAGYHFAPISQIVIVSCIFFVLLEDALSVNARLALTTVFLTLPSIVTSFSGLVFPDRNVVFWIACLLLSVRAFARTQSTAWAVTAGLSAQNMIYYKETAFLLLFGFAAGGLILRKKQIDGGRNCDWFWDKQSRLDLCFITLGLFFLAYYAATMIAHPNIQYAVKYQVSWGRALLYYVRLDLLPLLLVVVASRRAYLIWKRGLAPSPSWDGLAFGGVACYAAYLCLRLSSRYYMAPVDFIALLYIGRFVYQSWGKLSLMNRAGTLVLALAVLVQGLSASAFLLYERENLLQANTELADKVLAESLSAASPVKRLFFPFSGPNGIVEFASYLVYRGLPIERYETAVQPAARSGVILVSPTFTKDSPCVDYRDFICHADVGPAPDDLIVILPGDQQSLSANIYRRSGQILVSYEPRPRVPKWMYPVLNHWLHASVLRTE